MDIYELIESEDVRNWARKSCALTPYDMVGLILATTTISLEEKKALLLDLDKKVSDMQWIEEYRNCDFLDPEMEIEKEHTIEKFSYEDWKKQLEVTICTLDQVISPIYENIENDIFEAELFYLGEDSYIKTGMFDTFCSAKKYILNTLEEISKRDGEIEKEKYYGEIRLWKKTNLTCRFVQQSYIINIDGKVIFGNDNHTNKNIDVANIECDSPYYIRTPFQTGDIIEIDATPFLKPVIGVIFNHANVGERGWRDGCCNQWMIFEKEPNCRSQGLIQYSSWCGNSICFKLNARFEFQAIRMAYFYKGEIAKEKEWILRLSDLVKKEGFFDFLFENTFDKKMFKELGLVKDSDMERYQYIELFETKYLMAR